MRRFVALVATAVLASIGFGNPAAAQSAGCPQPLVITTVEENNFSVVNLAEFEGRVYLYATRIPRRQGGFEPFDLWVVEGVYGRPLVQSSGPMDPALFERLRKNSNVRATATRVQQNGQTGSVTIGRQAFAIGIGVAIPANRASVVTARICRAR